MSIDAVSRSALEAQQLHGLLEHVTTRLLENRAAAVAAVPEWDQLRECARAIKRATLASLDRHLDEFERQVRARGGVVHRAPDAAAACRIVADIADASGARRVVKSKSMVSEEIGLNSYLETTGRRVIETDFGEYIIQLAGERPSHIVAPAVHKSRSDVGRLFAEKLGVGFTDDPAALAAHARDVLRAEFLSADMGISGANFGVAETGTLVIVENEGNARFCTTLPRVHVAVMGIEKLVPSIEDLAVFLTLLPRNATGQAMTSYASFIGGPGRAGDCGGPRQVHVVLLDNGRSRMLADPVLREALTCIRCGACLNTCPVYRHIGGHTYGGVYTGPIGSLLGPGLEPRTSPPDLPFVSTLCGACADVCAVKIDIPSLLLYLRQRAMAGDTLQKVAHRRLQRVGLRGWAEAMAGPTRYALASRVLRVLSKPLARGGRIRRLPAPLNAWTEARDFPAPARETFRDSIRRHAPSVRAAGPTGKELDVTERGETTATRTDPVVGAPGLRLEAGQDLVEQFAARASSVQATVFLVTSADEARRRVTAILKEVGACRVVVSGDAWGPRWEIALLAGDRGDLQMCPTASLEAQACDDVVRTADAGITGVAHAIAETGTLVVRSGRDGGRLESLVPRVHIALVDAHDVVPGLRDVLWALQREQALTDASAVTFITGPSRTADIEMTLTIGVHGPHQLFVVVLSG